jgi:hypothetical protein
VKRSIHRRRFLNNSMIAVGGAWVLGRPASVAQAQVAASGQMPAKPDAVLKLLPASILKLHSTGEATQVESAAKELVVHAKEKEATRLLVAFDLPDHAPKRTAYASLNGSYRAFGVGAPPFLLLKGINKETAGGPKEDFRQLLSEAEPLNVATLRENQQDRFGFRAITRFANKILGQGKKRVSFIIEVPGFPGRHEIKYFTESIPEVVEIAGAPSSYQQVGLENLSLEIVETGPRYEIDEIMRPLWETDFVFRESVLNVRRDDQFEESKLLFRPDRIIEVWNHSLDRRYQEGVDYEMTAEGLRLTAGTSAPFGRVEEMFPPQAFNRPGEATRPLLKGGNLLLSEAYYKPRQLTVSYQSRNKIWDGPRLVAKPNLLPRTVSKLRAGEALKVIVTGDSVARGGSASGYGGSPPYQPTWSYLVAEYLEKNTGARIDLTNAAGLFAPSFFVEAKPDLLVLESVSPAGLRFFRPIIEMIRRAKLPTEIIILLPLQTNPEAIKTGPYLEYLTELRKMERPGLAVADAWNLHGEMLKRKSYMDMTGNNFNHPNDFLIRVIAQSVAYLLMPPKLRSWG